MAPQNHKSFRGKAYKPFRVIEIISQRKWKIGVLGALLFLLLSPLAFLLYDTYYVANATLRISPTLPTFLSASDDRNIVSYYHDYARTQVSRIKRLQVLMTALNRLPPELRNQFVTDEQTMLQAAAGLRQAIQVSQVPQTHLIRVGLKQKSPEGLAELINNVVNVYLEKLQEEEEGVDNHRLAYLRQERRGLEARLGKQSAALKDISLKTGVTDFSMPESHHHTRVTQLQEAFVDAQTRSLQTKNYFENAMKEAEALQGVGLTAAVDLEKEKDPILANAKMWTHSRLRDIETRMLGYSDIHPERKILSARAADIEKLFQDLEQEVEKEALANVEEKRSLALKEKAIKAEFAYLTAKKTETDLKVQLDKAKEELTAYSQHVLQGRAYEKEHEQTEELLSQLDARIYALQVESKAPGRASLDSIARSIPHNNLMKYLVMLFGIAFSSATAFVVLSERRDQLIRSSKDVEQAIGAPPSWPIEDYRSKSGPRMAFSRCTMESPQSTSARALRSLAVKLNKERCSFGAKMAVFTGVESKVGTTAILMNCAQSMTQLCDKVLVLDMNTRTPRASHLILGDKHDRTILDAIDGHASIDECILHDKERRVDVIAAPPVESMQALDRGKLLSIIEELKQRYDFVLVDTAPLLDSDMTEFMLIQSDVAVPIILGNRTRYREAHDCVKLLLRLEVSAVAPVLNQQFLSQRPKRRRRPTLRCRPMLRLRVTRRENRRERELERSHSFDHED